MPHDEFTLGRAIARRAQIVVVVGASGVVEPAANLVRDAQHAGVFIIVIGPHEFELSRATSMIIHDIAARALPELLCTCSAILFGAIAAPLRRLNND